MKHERIVFERATAAGDDYGEGPPTWGAFADAFAEVLFGTGQERREAAQEGGAQAATFKCPWTPTLETVVLKDRISAFGAYWDISSIAPVGRAKEIHFTAVRSL